MTAAQQRATEFGKFLDAIAAPTPKQTWLEQAAAKIREERDREIGDDHP